MNSMAFCIIANVIYTISVLILGGISIYYGIQNKRNGLLWKGHLKLLFAGMMTFISVVTLFDITLIVNNIDLEKNHELNTLMQMIYFLPANFVGLILLCISGHNHCTVRRVANHFLPYILVIASYAVYPDIGWPWVLVILYSIYSTFVTYKYIKSDKYTIEAAGNMYVNKFEHIPPTRSLIIIIIYIAGIFYILSLITPINGYAVELFFIPIWMYLLHIIKRLKESELIAPLEDDYFEFVLVENLPARPTKEMTATMKYIAENIEKTLLDNQFFANKELNAQMLAERMGTNRTYISQYLNSIGTNFSALVNEMRMQYAKELLTTTDESIADISLKCGYHTTTTFRKFFVEAYNCQPEDFERKAK